MLICQQSLLIVMVSTMTILVNFKSAHSAPVRETISSEKTREQLARPEREDFVRDNVPLEEILRLIAEAEQKPRTSTTKPLITSSTARPTTQSFEITPSSTDIESSRSVDGPASDFRCRICSKSMPTSGSELTECGHRFHSKCLDKLGVQTFYRTCPACHRALRVVRNRLTKQSRH